MENLDIYILTSVVATLFIVFGITIYREFNRMEKDSYKFDPDAAMYGRDALFDLAAKLFEDAETKAKRKNDKKERKKRKNLVHRDMYKTIADMESCGVYFPEEVRDELLKTREESVCKYSGLPSAKSYE